MLRRCGKIDGGGTGVGDGVLVGRSRAMSKKLAL
jgi:hypothetical protein